MRPYLFFLTMACAAVLTSAIGCGDNRGGAGGPDAAGGTDAGVDVDAAVDAPTDTGASVCDVVWHDFQFGTDLDDQIWGLTTDANRNIYAAGYEHGRTGPTNMTNLEPEGDSQGVVIKFDPTGAVAWKTVFDTPTSDTVEDVTVEPGSGRLYVAGRTFGAFTGFTNNGQFDTFLAVLEPTGQITNIFQTGNERPQHPARLNLGPNRSVLVAGYDDLYVDGTAVISRDAGFIASFERGVTPDAPFKQNFLQKAQVSSQVVNRITGVAVDGDGSGSMYVTSFVTGGPMLGTYVKKLNSDGTLVWSHLIARSSTTMANAVAMSPSNDLIVAGVAGVQLGSMSFGGQDAFVMKVDKATGDPLWVAQQGSLGSDFTTAMAIDNTGNIYIAGETSDSVVQGGTNQGSFDAFAMKFAPDGTLLSTWQKGTATYDFTRSIVVDHCGKVFVGVHSQTGLVGSSPSTAGGYDMFVLQATL